MEETKNDKENIDNTIDKKDISFDVVDLPMEDPEKIREELKTLSDLVDKTKSQLEDHKGKSKFVEQSIFFLHE